MTIKWFFFNLVRGLNINLQIYNKNGITQCLSSRNALQVQQLINGWTPLHYAEGNVECMKILINAGADIHYRTPDGPIVQ